MTKHHVHLMSVIGKHYHKDKNTWKRLYPCPDNNEFDHTEGVEGEGGAFYPDAYIVVHTMKIPTAEVEAVIEVEMRGIDANTRCVERWGPLSRAFRGLHLFVSWLDVYHTVCALRDHAQDVGDITLYQYEQALSGDLRVVPVRNKSY